MKFLFIVKVMLRDWMSVHRRYTFIILITMILSVQALFFIAVKNAGNNIEDAFLEKYSHSTYQIYAHEGESLSGKEYEEFEKNYPGDCPKLDRELMDKYLASDLPMPCNYLGEDVELTGLEVIQVYAVNGIPMYELKGLEKPFEYLPGFPVFEECDRKYEAVFNIAPDNYRIVEGRDYTEADLTEHNHVLVVNENESYQLGDKLDCGKYEFEVIGIAHSDGYGLSSPLPYWFAEESMSEYLGEREFEYADDWCTFLGGYDCTTTFAALTLEKPLTRAQKKELCGLLGVKSSDITMPYSDFYEEEYAAYYRTTIIESAVFGLFCAANIILAIWSLCQKHIDTLRTFRVYGASAKTEILLIVTLIMCMTMAAVVVGGALCLPMQKLYENINPIYAWRPYCMVTALAALVIINLLTAIPTAVLTVRRSPVGK
ncbi:MAG: hypothetical protein K6C68_11065 [Ruminococcus sp.]|nr:hypothetical protein [Ruminococcus sp.]